MSKNDSKNTAIKAALAADSKKASPVLVFDLCGKSTLADYAVLATVDSPPQLEAVEEEVLIRLKHDGVFCLYKDGTRSKNWKVLDYGGVLVHVLERKTAELYDMEKLFLGSKPVQWEEKPAAPAAKAPAPKAKKPAAKKAAVKKPAAKKTAVKKAAKPAKAKAAAKKTAKKKK
jgi:ribosome-associated protein